MSLGERALERHGEAFLQSFEAIRRALALYPANHPDVGRHLGRLVKALTELRAATGDATVNVAGAELYLNGVPLKRLSLSWERILRQWEELGLGLIRFGAETTNESALGFFQALALGRDEIAARGGLAAVLERAGVRSIRVARVAADVASDQPLAAEPPALAAAPSSPEEARSRFRDSLAGLGTILADARAGAHGPARLSRILAHALEARLLERPAVRALAQELRAHDAGAHRRALAGAMASLALGATLGLARERLLLLGEAALLRDVGVTRIPPDALGARGSDPQARAEWERHPAIGAKLLLATSGIDASAAIVAHEHHLGLDGRGYPQRHGKKGLHPFSRIVAVASDYDEKTAAGASPADAVREIVAQAGTTYDLAAVRAQLRLVGYLPEGTGVTLRDGRRGVVAGIGELLGLAPEVALLADASGSAIEPRIIETASLLLPGEPLVVDTWKPRSLESRRLEPLVDLE